MSDYFDSLLRTLCIVCIIVGGVYTASYVVDLNDRLTVVEQRLDNRINIPDFIPNITIGDK
jgi:hypothetical protein